MFKRRKQAKRQKQVESVVNMLLLTPNLSYKSQIEIIEGGFRLLAPRKK